MRWPRCSASWTLGPASPPARSRRSSAPRSSAKSAGQQSSCRNPLGCRPKEIRNPDWTAVGAATSSCAQEACAPRQVGKLDAKTPADLCARTRDLLQLHVSKPTEHGALLRDLLDLLWPPRDGGAVDPPLGYGIKDDKDQEKGAPGFVQRRTFCVRTHQT